jgi:23S rRNA pseudouridine1911/1915/1917 synthase
MTEEWVWVPFEVEKKFDGLRIDRFLTQRLTSYSRSKIQKILSNARVMKGERLVRASTKVFAGEKISVAYLRRPEEPLAAEACLPVLFEDDDLLVIDKPADLLSHPTDKIVKRTVIGVLRHSRPDLPSIHLLHRLDRETSGVLVLAKNADAARAWTKAMVRGKIHKEYLALVRGVPKAREGVIDWPIGREGKAVRVRQWINAPDAKEAVTAYQVVRSFESENSFSLVRAFPRTGRLHQIRVHLAALGHPLLGDPLYNGDGSVYLKMTQQESIETERAALGFPRVALHAAAISFPHPVSGQSLRVESPFPADMACFMAGIAD